MQEYRVALAYYNAEIDSMSNDHDDSAYNRARDSFYKFHPELLPLSLPPLGQGDS
jgi:hypothetical protein